MRCGIFSRLHKQCSCLDQYWVNDSFVNEMYIRLSHWTNQKLYHQKYKCHGKPGSIFVWKNSFLHPNLFAEPFLYTFWFWHFDSQVRFSRSFLIIRKRQKFSLHLMIQMTIQHSLDEKNQVEFLIVSYLHIM